MGTQFKLDQKLGAGAQDEFTDNIAAASWDPPVGMTRTNLITRLKTDFAHGHIGCSPHLNHASVSGFPIGNCRCREWALQTFRGN
jgi:hypothetical protein